MKNVKVSKIFRLEEDDVNSFEKRYGKGLLTIFFRNCLEKAVDKNGFNFVQSVLFGNDISSDKNYIN